MSGFVVHFMHMQAILQNTSPKVQVLHGVGKLFALLPVKA